MKINTTITTISLIFKHYLTPLRKKTSLGKCLAGSQAYNPIRDSRRDCWREFSRQKVSPTVSAGVPDRIICMTPYETPRLVFFSRAMLVTDRYIFRIFRSNILQLVQI